jgi:hypothetical protein
VAGRLVADAARLEQRQGELHRISMIASGPESRHLESSRVSSKTPGLAAALSVLEKFFECIGFDPREGCSRTARFA